MIESLLQSPLPIAVLLIYLMVTAILGSLAFYRRNHIELHDRVRKGREMRLQYVESIIERQKRHSGASDPADPSPQPETPTAEQPSAAQPPDRPAA